MKYILEKLKLLLEDPQLKRKTIISLFLFLCFRVFAFYQFLQLI